MSSFLVAKNIHKSFKQGSSHIEILKGINLEIRQGEALSIVGSSGAGKSTLMHILGTLDQPTSGELYFNGLNLFNLNDEELAKHRNQNMGFVFQFHHLLKEFTALENVMIPLRVGGMPVKQAQQEALAMIEHLGLSHRFHHYPTELSGGELQRVAICRALVKKPQILFADEPTGNLDAKNSQSVQDLFFELKEKLGLTLVVVTHDISFAKKFSRTLTISDGHWATSEIVR